MDNLIKDYEADVMRTANEGITQPLVYGTMKLAEEAGEACGIVAKHIGQGHVLDLAKLEEELGDALYFLVYTAKKAGSSLERVIANNVRKRANRYPNGFEVERSVNRGRE